MESFIGNSIWAQLDQNYPLNNAKHSIISNRYSQTRMSCTNLDISSLQAVGYFFYFSKAFDISNSRLLMAKQAVLVVSRTFDK